MTFATSPPDIEHSDPLQCGYVHVKGRGFQAVAQEWTVSAVGTALSAGTLHEWAALQDSKEEMRGRGVIYSVVLPTNPPMSVVVRRNRHGGLFGALTGEYFLTPTRAPLELQISLRLAAAGIPTPEVIAYAVYPVGGIFARSDVVTRRLPPGGDLPEVWRHASDADREVLLSAVASLLHSLAAAGAWHADLNLKNLYIAGNGSALTVYLLDVDRVTFPGDGDVYARNLQRLIRSARKWKVRWGLDFDEESIERLARLAEEKK
ncbi:MAG: lipopolysaccharide kinase InaA family protein [Desulfuromonadaceae bacterium]|nr:lipopolysaccharide kinase InaA family protein [Desulfuromonadaceae bacterium]